MLTKNKVYAYITRGNNLLVFRHVDFPEAGIQVPGGTMEDGEDPLEAVLREAYEETGLDKLQVASYLGSDEWILAGEKGEKERIQRHFYHLNCHPNAPDRWLHEELNPSDGSPAPITFEFYWLPVESAAHLLPPYFQTQLENLVAILRGTVEH